VKSQKSTGQRLLQQRGSAALSWAMKIFSRYLFPPSRGGRS